MFWLLNLYAIISSIGGFAFACTLFIIWLRDFLKVHFQNRKEKDR